MVVVGAAAGVVSGAVNLNSPENTSHTHLSSRFRGFMIAVRNAQRVPASSDLRVNLETVQARQTTPCEGTFCEAPALATFGKRYAF